MIELKNIRKTYGKVKVLNDISLKIHKHQLTVLIGANGAGKSTALNIIGRLLDYDQGEIYIDHKKLESYPSLELAKKLSILKQSHHLHIRIKVKDLVAFGRYPHNKGKLVKEDYEIIQKAIDYMNIQDIQDKYINELSGGQQQRVYIAMVLAQDSEYILLDEPLNNLDLKHGALMMKTLQEIVRDFNKTVIVVIHDINYASAYADQVIAFKEGQILFHDSKDSLNSSCLEDVFNHSFKQIKDQDMHFYQYYK